MCICGMVCMLMVCLVYGTCGVGVRMLCAHIVSGGCLYLKWHILLAKLVRVPDRYTNFIMFCFQNHVKEW